MLPLLFLGDLGSFSSRSRGAVWDLGHLVLFFILTVAVVGRLPAPPSKPWVRVGLVILCAGAVAVGIEWLQGFIGRSQSVGDVVLSVGGTVLALLVAPWWAPARIALSRWRLVLAVALIAAATAPTCGYLWDEVQARSQLPKLAGFESDLEMTRWNLIGEHERVRLEDSPNNWGLRLRSGPDSLVFWQLKHTPADWSTFSALTMRVQLEGEPVGIQCVVYDWAHEHAAIHEDSDHYSERFQLEPGWQEIRIDLRRAASSLSGRQMELTDIASFWCRGEEVPRQSTLLVDYVRLEK